MGGGPPNRSPHLTRRHDRFLGLQALRVPPGRCAWRFVRGRGCMTEAGWLACDGPEAKLRALRRTGTARRAAGRRKLRLFGCACVRSQWGRVTDARSRALVVAAERYADGLAGAGELAAAELAALKAREQAKGLVVVGAGVRSPPWCL